MAERQPRDIFADSSAWRRLTSPSPKDWQPETTRLKHDVTNVFQTLLAATQELQMRHADIVDLQERREEAYNKMYVDLFDPRNGAFATTQRYIDGRFARVQNLGWGLLGALLTSGIMLIVQLVVPGK